MENEHFLDINTDNLPMTSSPKDQSPASFSRDLIGRLGISSQGTETVIPETQRSNDILFVLYHQNINTYVILYICYSYMQEANIFIPGEVVI